MGLSDRALEFDALAFDLEKDPAFLVVHGGAQFRLQRGHLVQDVVDSFVHGSSIGPCTRASVAAPPANARLPRALSNRRIGRVALQAR